MAYTMLRVDLSELETADMVDELEERGFFVFEEDVSELEEADILYDDLCEKLEHVYNLRKQGLNYIAELDSIFEEHLGVEA